MDVLTYLWNRLPPPIVNSELAAVSSASSSLLEDQGIDSPLFQGGLYGQFLSSVWNINNNNNNNMLTLRSILLVLFVWTILIALTGSAESFRVFLQRLRNQRKQEQQQKQRTAVESPRPTPIPEQQQQQDEMNLKDDPSSSSLGSSTTPSSLREASRVLLQEFWGDWGDFSLFNFSLTSSEEEADILRRNASTPERDYNADVVHFCFLVHGHRGFSKDLSYLQAVMHKNVQQQKRNDEDSSSSSFSKNDTSHSHPPQQRQDLVVHAANCNERRTDDGVEAGGVRLMEEVRSVIRKEMEIRQAYHQNRTNSSQEDRERLPVITVSFLGNSLGGLYSRYAIAKLCESCQPYHNASSPEEEDQEDGAFLWDGRYKLYLNIFCTTATPHLGVASHTFIRIPRTAELGVAHAMGQTGRDLFRVNPLMRQMATVPQFLNPMKLFRQRIAYANAYGTDFPVPVQTAAFLHDESDYPHHFISNKLRDKIAEEHSDLCVATVYTPPQQQPSNDRNKNDSRIRQEPSSSSQPAEPQIQRRRTRGENGAGTSGRGILELAQTEQEKAEEEDNNDLIFMSRSLDSLGWKKVFVDPRKIVPKLSNPITRFPKVAATLRLGLSSSSSSVNNNNNTSNSDGESSSSSSVAISDASDLEDETSEINSILTPEQQAQLQSQQQQQAPDQTQNDPQQDSVHSTSATASSSNTLSSSSSSSTTAATTIELLQARGVAPSREVFQAVTTSPTHADDPFHWPFGHNMIVAMSRNSLYTYLNKSGRPIVDALAAELVEDIFAFEVATTTTEEEPTKTQEQSCQ